MRKRYTTFCVSFDTLFGWLTLEATQKGLKRIRFGKFCDTLTDSELLKKAKNDILNYLHGKKVGANPCVRPLFGDRHAGLPLHFSMASFGGDKPQRYGGLDKSEVVGRIYDRIDFSGLTPIQVKVLREVDKIPYGKTISYKELARLVGTSPRACGRVLASNPLPIIIPCHRVIYANGKLGGYSGGFNWKRNLLKLEQTTLPSRAGGEILKKKI